jgi:hypothetical protein
VRRTLVTALVSCAATEARARLRRFLAGLSADELEFLAGFQGARILERCGMPSGAVPSPPGQVEYSTRAAGWAGDFDHKMIVLREYLTRCGSAGWWGIL